MKTAKESSGPPVTHLGEKFFNRAPVTCARALVGCRLVWGKCEGLVVETEAYSEVGDPACHTFSRKSSRHFVESYPAGTAYVYLNYGMYWLFNVLVKTRRERGFVLIRALEPLEGLGLIRRRRGLGKRVEQLCSGPGKLTRALGIEGRDHGRSLCMDPARGFHRRRGRPEIVSDVRIGISKAADLPWRFLIKDNPHVSEAAPQT